MPWCGLPTDARVRGLLAEGRSVERSRLRLARGRAVDPVGARHVLESGVEIVRWSGRRSRPVVGASDLQGRDEHRINSARAPDQ